MLYSACYVRLSDTQGPDFAVESVGPPPVATETVPFLVQGGRFELGFFLPFFDGQQRDYVQSFAAGSLTGGHEPYLFQPLHFFAVSITTSKLTSGLPQWI